MHLPQVHLFPQPLIQNLEHQKHPSSPPLINHLFCVFVGVDYYCEVSIKANIGFITWKYECCRRLSSVIMMECSVSVMEQSYRHGMGRLDVNN